MKYKAELVLIVGALIYGGILYLLFSLLGGSIKKVY